MNLAKEVFAALLQYGGFFLVLFLFSEEFRRLVTWFGNFTRQHPRLRILCYPLAVLLTLAVTALIAHSFLTLFATVRFSYE